MKTIKFLKDFQNEKDSKLIAIEEYAGALKVRELLQVLKKMNPEAICLSEYDGSVYAITEPKPIKLREIWGEGEYTGACYFYEEDDDGTISKGKDAVFFD